ncbi:uncharacterized protein [Triticum aestivum]|uniref:uncharacterized protein isoform X2 n=1 Tax=Triticum aestivum TaxID=4565 RepID=UPI001D007049|nr:uncharacterized protein LOC123069125 isoform X2 [Triticum aestivum]
MVPPDRALALPRCAVAGLDRVDPSPLPSPSMANSTREEMAIDEAELEPLEFAEKMHTQQEITTTGSWRVLILIQVYQSSLRSRSKGLLRNAPVDIFEEMRDLHCIQSSPSTIADVAPVGTVHLALSITTQAAGLLAVVVFTLFHHHEADHRCDVVQHWREGWPASRRPRLGGLQVRLVGMVTGKMERNTDVSFTLDNDTGCINFSSDGIMD